MPAIWITIAFCAGVISGDLFSWGPWHWFWSSLICSSALFFLIYLLERKSNLKLTRYRRLVLSLVISYFLGGLRYQVALPDFSNPAYILNFVDQDKPVEITGMIRDFPEPGDQTIQIIVETEALEDPSERTLQEIQGRMLVRIPAENHLTYGEKVKVSGYLRIPPEGEDFNYRDYLKRQRIYVYMTSSEIQVLEEDAGASFLLRKVYFLRSLALDLIYQLWPDPEASLLSGILLGVESGISENVEKAFRETGTTHIIAISGFNITIVAGLFSSSFSRIFNPRQAAFVAVLGIGFYTLLVGADPAVVRAAIMGGLSIIAKQIGRRQNGLNALALASLIMILINPQIPWDISFQLSLTATLGLVLYADGLTNSFSHFVCRFLPQVNAQRLVGPVSEYFLMTFAAQITTLPVMLYHFHTFSWSSFLTNPAILPVQPPIMILGGLAVILGLIYLPLGKIAAPLVFPFVLYTIRVVEWFSNLPIHPGYTDDLSWGWIVFYYLLLAVVTFGGSILGHYYQFISISTASSGLILIVLIIWRLVFSAPDGLFHFYLLDVGTGSAIYLQTPSGQRVIINGGPSTRRLSDHLGRLLPPFQREIDYWIVASPLEQDLDAITENIKRFSPENVLWLGEKALCWEAENLRSSLIEGSYPMVDGRTGQTLILGDGIKINIISVGRRGGSLLLEYDSLRILLPFGLSKEARDSMHLGLDLGNVTTLMLADNGYQSSNPAAWISNLNPQLVLLSVGTKDNRGLPDRGLISRLAGYSLLRTDQQGTVHLSSDGKKLWVEVERLP